VRLNTMPPQRAKTRLRMREPLPSSPRIRLHRPLIAKMSGLPQAPEMGVPNGKERPLAMTLRTSRQARTAHPAPPAAAMARGDRIRARPMPVPREERSLRVRPTADQREVRTLAEAGAVRIDRRAGPLRAGVFRELFSA